MSRVAVLASAFALAAAFAAPASATTQLIDGGFETQAAGLSDFCYFPACGSGAWTYSGLAGFQDESNPIWPGLPTSDGSKYGFIQREGALSQTFTSNDSGAFSLNWFDAGRPEVITDGNQSYDVVLSSALGVVTLGSFATTSYQPFTARSVASFNLISGTAYTLTFQGSSISGGDHTAYIDAASLTAIAVPEPASWALMILGFGGVGVTLRAGRRRTLAAA